MTPIEIIKQLTNLDYNAANIIRLNSTIMKKMNYIRMFDEREFVLVCRKSDYENDIIGNGLFLVCREEWEDTTDYYSIKTFNLLLTAVENKTVKLFPDPDDAVVVLQTLPYARRDDYIEIKPLAELN